MSDRPLALDDSRRRTPAQKKLDRVVTNIEAREAFWRMVKLVRTHRKRMVIGILLSFVAAIAYAGSLGGMLPVLKTLVREESIRAVLLEKAAEEDAWYNSWMMATAEFFPEENTPETRMHTLVILLSVLLAVNLVGNIARVYSQYLVLYASHRVVMDLRRRMYRKTLHVSLDRISGDASARISQFLTDVREVFLGISTLFGKVAREPVKAVCVLCVALYINASLTLVVLAITPVAVGTLWYFGRKIRKANMKLLAGYGKMLGGLEETLQGIDVVKGYVREGYERKRMWTLERGMMKQQLKMAWIEAMASPLMEVLGVIVASLAVVWLARKTFAGELGPDDFIVMVVLLAGMLDPVRKVANVYNIVQRSGAASSRIFGFLDETDELSVHGRKVLSVGGQREINIENVTFRYNPTQQPPALDNVSLHVKAGECIAIVGPNGSGKSTFVKLLPRFLQPQSGLVTIDGVNVDDLSLRNLRHEIAIVSQRPVIFARSVSENIAYADEYATDEQIRAAAQRAYAAEFIEQWPDKYETVMGEFGASVSGGQRQRIAIARAFLKKSSILIFDEATSEIDTESERKIHNALNELRQGKTTFMIAHRHTVMEMAQKIVVMDVGRIVDVGTHAELIQRCPLYVALYRSPTTTA